MMDKNTTVTTILAIVIIVSTVFGMSARYVSRDQFGEFKEGIVGRLERIEIKLDTLLEP